MVKPVRYWLPGRRLILVVVGGFATVQLASVCVKSQVIMGCRTHGGRPCLSLARDVVSWQV